MPAVDALRRVEVAVRVRPSLDASKEGGTCIELDERRNTISVHESAGHYAAPVQNHSYRQDLLFNERSTNRDVFQRLVLEKMQLATPESPDTLCFLAYGHTSSGKTHTIAGSEQEPGVLTLCVEELLRRDGLVEVSMLEVYMDAVHDLLAEGALRRVRRRQGPGGAPVIVVEELTTCSLVSLAQWRAVSTYGTRSRRTAPTERNARSSRSHAIFTIKSRGVRLCLVDLAGSERQTVFSPQLNKESIAINKSLSRLSTVLEALSTQRVSENGRRSYVNFRDTTLTVLLQRYLSGASMTTFLACVHPAEAFYQETLSTLRYTHRLKKMRTSVTRPGGPGDVSALLTPALAAEHQALLDELARLRAQMQESDVSAQRVEVEHQRRIAELEAAAVATSAAKGANSASAIFGALRAKDTKRVAGWLLSRVLGDLPLINVGYDDYFDAFFPDTVQVIGYVSTMACLPPRSQGPSTLTSEDGALAFLDVGELAMGLSMVDAGIPSFVRLHAVPCNDPSTWEGQEWDADGHIVYVLAFFQVDDSVVEATAGLDEDGSRLPCCGGHLSTEPLLPIATVLCVPSSLPPEVKEEVLQRLVSLQGEQEEAFDRRAGASASMTSFDGSIDAYLDRSLCAAAADGAEKVKDRASPTLTSDSSAASAASTSSLVSSSSYSGALAREMRRQAMDTTKLSTPFKDPSGSGSSSTGGGESAVDNSAAAAAAATDTAVVTGPLPAARPLFGATTQPMARRPEAVGPQDVHVTVPQQEPPESPAALEAPTIPVAPRHKGRKGGRGTVGEADSDKVVKPGSCHGCVVA